jgi:hypothetical protein
MAANDRLSKQIAGCPDKPCITLLMKKDTRIIWATWQDNLLQRAAKDMWLLKTDLTVHVVVFLKGYVAHP